jgi:hypothetical protein
MYNTMKVYEFTPNCPYSGGNLLIAAESKREAVELAKKNGNSEYLEFSCRVPSLTAKLKNYGLPYVILDRVCIE